MNNKRFVVFFLFLYSFLFCEEYNVETLINQIEKNSYAKELSQVSIERLELKNDKIDKTYNNGIDVSGSSSIYHHEDYGNTRTSVDVGYDFLAYQMNIDHDENEISNLIGVRKDLRDIFYSEKEYNKNMYEWEKVQELNNISKNIDEEIINFIDLYKEYKNVEAQLNFEKENIDSLKTAYDVLKKSYELGEVQKLDYELSEVEYSNSKLSIDVYEEQLKAIRDQMNFTYLLNIQEIDNLKDFENEDKKIDPLLFEMIGQRDIENKEMDIEVLREEAKYSKYTNDYPSVTAGAYYDIEENEPYYSISFSKTLFNEDFDTENLEIDIKEEEINLRQLSSDTNSTILDYKKEYANLLKETLVSKNLSEVDEKEYIIYKKRYQLGMSNFVDVRDKYDDYKTSTLSYYNNKNELLAFKYQLPYRR